MRIACCIPARDKSDLVQFARRTTGFREVTGSEISNLEPDLGNRFSKGLFFESEAHLAPRTALDQLRDSVVADGGQFAQDDADPAKYAQRGLTIDCRGYQAKDRHKDLRGVKGEMLILSCPDVALTRPIRMLHPRIPLYIVPRGKVSLCSGRQWLKATQASTSLHVRCWNY